MIGVIADSADFDVVREFFELFKTPWEFFRANQQYEVLLCAADIPFNATAKVVLVYAGEKVRFDEARYISISKRVGGLCVLSDKETEIPIYGGAVSLTTSTPPLLTHQKGGECAAFFERIGDKTYIRIGYDLFAEIRRLLTEGQPPAQAHIPTLELHIDLLRRWIIGCGIELDEIPPVPDGYRFVACLTHDVDHPSIRLHKWDHTMFGFLYRALLGSLLNLIRRRLSFRGLIANWSAACKLPFVHLGWMKDFWRDFDERYLELEKDLPSTFYVIPTRQYAGIRSQGANPKFRAAGYGANDIADIIRRQVASGREVGLHGIDAWIDSSKGREELGEIRRLTNAMEIGVRMHWLCFDQQSPKRLEMAGFDYDSTSGYNETEGYRSGTGQAFKPLEVVRLLELPMHVMDSALFYPGRQNLSARQAIPRVTTLIENAERYGGCLTLNWHDRSLSPERMWDQAYREVLRELKKRNPWFATAGDAVAWFRKRRSATFVKTRTESGETLVHCAADVAPDLPGLILRSHKPAAHLSLGSRSVGGHLDLPVREVVAASALPAV